MLRNHKNIIDVAACKFHYVLECTLRDSVLKLCCVYNYLPSLKVLGTFHAVESWKEKRVKSTYFATTCPSENPFLDPRLVGSRHEKAQSFDDILMNDYTFHH